MLFESLPLSFVINQILLPRIGRGDRHVTVNNLTGNAEYGVNVLPLHYLKGILHPSGRQSGLAGRVLLCRRRF